MKILIKNLAQLDPNVAPLGPIGPSWAPMWPNSCPLIPEWARLASETISAIISYDFL